MADAMTVTVLVTVYNDHRLERCVRSVLEGTRVPQEVLVADGGSTDGTWDLVRELDEEHEAVRALRLPGSVAETRNAALPEARGDIVAFLDADEVAPEGWLDALVAPIEAGEAGFTGGPTEPWDEPRSRAEAYVNAFDDWFYEHVVPHNLGALPMGNSAWRRNLLLEVGGFDPRITWGGEDYDLNLRVLASGAHGAFVPEAWVYHDQSGLDTLRKLLRRKYNYAKGASVAYLKNDVLQERLPGSVSTSTTFHHPFDVLFLLLKPLALLTGWIAWKRMERGEPELAAVEVPDAAPGDEQDAEVGP